MTSHNTDPLVNDGPISPAHVTEVGLSAPRSKGVSSAWAGHAVYRNLSSRLAIVELAAGTSLADHLLRTAEAVEVVERDECGPSEAVSHAVVEYEGGDGIWTTLLVIE